MIMIATKEIDVDGTAIINCGVVTENLGKAKEVVKELCITNAIYYEIKEVK